ncbi:GH36-type glycosyl hydrolase domain-containing protein [Persicobacter diffluens]|uniref:N,N'-diacetylchitobiose phosphorylase n=1 Tax=Persicobacter diffluens TaxID=981 RepID=A0AAN4W4E8_9BACT|nr:N,N'-diacetylchitobiose phosphorylase [Persicobacter diffluens]
MRFGYFDNKRREYVIDNPATPRSWTNYLGSTAFGSVITNNAGGYTFYKSAAQGRFLRMPFNSVPMDQPGRYLYLHDHDQKDFWSNSWQPVGKPLSAFKNICRHGTGYTTIASEYKKISSEATYFVPNGKNYECWIVKVKNEDTKHRQLSLFTYVEYASNWNAQDDLINLQYTQYIVNVQAKGNIIDHGTNINLPELPDNFEEKDQGRHTFLAISGALVKGHDTDREAFLGPYRTYANPIVVEEGQCRNSSGVGDNGCGVFQVPLSLAPGEEKSFLVLMGVGAADKEGKAAVADFDTVEKAEQALEEVKQTWHSQLNNFSVDTPDEDFNNFLNTWAPYNCLITNSWSRAASLIYNGERDGLGYRDSVQDVMGTAHLIPEATRERLRLMLSGQVSTGGALPVVKPFAHYPGKMQAPSAEEYRSDDCLWLFNAVPLYVQESGEVDFYKEVIPYADQGEDTVFGHLRRAIMFNLERLGQHGLPCGLLADWNDCLELGQAGETTFVAFQLRHALITYQEIAELLAAPEEAAWAKTELEKVDQNIAENAWDGEWFLRAYRHDGLKFGSQENEEGKIFLNPQVWSIISGYADAQQQEKVLKQVREQLATDFGVMVCAPPFVKTDYTVVRATLMNPGMKENAGIFNHTQGWAIMAEALAGNGDQAYAYFKATNPATYNESAEVRECEPYVVCQSTHSKYSPKYGASRLPWLSGAATWLYYAATQHILGVQPVLEGIKIDPCIPAHWKEFSVQRIFRDKTLHIAYKNPEQVQKGVKSIELNGTTLQGQMIPMELLQDTNNIIITLG